MADSIENKAPRIVLADPPSEGSSYDRSYPNMGVLSLIAYLRRERPGLDIRYVEGFCTLAEHVAKVKELQPDIYGISFAYLTLRAALATMKAVREACPRTKIICGGPGPTPLAQRVLDESPVDCVVIGEGELTLVELTDRLLAGGELATVDGIAYRAEGKVVFTPKRKLIENLDTLPFPAWDMIDLSRYPGQHYCRSEKQACLVISRGCPYHCAFCSNPVWRVSNPAVRVRSPQHVAQEVEQLYAMGVREIKFVSDELNPNLPWAKKVCRAIADLGHKDLFFQTNLRADKIDDEFVALLQAMGCWLVHLGAESANNRVLGGIGKGVAIEQIEHACRMLKKARIKVFLFMMAFQLWTENGKVYCESPREVAHSLWFVLRMRLKRLISYMSWSVATPMPDSPLWEAATMIESGFEHEVLDSWDRNQDYLGFPLRSLGITDKQRQRMMRLGILTKGLFAILSGRFSFRRHWHRIPIILKSFLRGSRMGRAQK